MAVSEFEVANELDDAVQQAFVGRPHLVDVVDGFVSMEVWRGLDVPKRFWLVTRWTDEDAYRTWHRSHTYRDSHAGIPKGLKLVRGSARIHRMTRVAQ